MPKHVVTFTNLPQNDKEKKRRVDAFEAGVKLYISNADFSKKDHDDDGNWIDDELAYDTKARNLTGGDVYFTSCRPTLRFIWKYFSAKPIVVGGMAFPGNWPPRSGDEYYYDYYKKVHGYVSYDLRIVPKWIKLLMAVFEAINKTCDQIAVITDSRQDKNRGARLFYEEIQAQAGSVGVWPPIGIDKGLQQVKSDLNSFKQTYPNGGIIVPAITLTSNNRQGLIDYINNTIKLPVVYPNVLYVNDGGLISLGVDILRLYGEAGEVVGQLLQDPNTAQTLTLWADGDSKFEVALNVTTAANSYQYNSTMRAKLKILADKIVR
jgi:hypothetical protein